MKLDFKTLYWLIIVLATSIFLYIRASFFDGSTLTEFDKVLLSIWTVLLLIPIVKEISLFGMSFKSDLERTKNELSEKINDVKYSIQANISNLNSNRMENHFYLPKNESEKLKESKAIREVTEQVNEDSTTSALSNSAQDYLKRIQNTILTEKQAILYLKANGYPNIKEGESIVVNNKLFQFDGFAPPDETNEKIAQIFEVTQYSGKYLKQNVNKRAQKLIEMVATYETETKNFAEGFLVIVVNDEEKKKEAKKLIETEIPKTRYLKTCIIVEITEH